MDSGSWPGSKMKIRFWPATTQRRVGSTGCGLSLGSERLLTCRAPSERAAACSLSILHPERNPACRPAACQPNQNLREKRVGAHQHGARR